MSSPLTPLAGAFIEALIPLYAACKDASKLQLLIEDLGWLETLDEEVLLALPFVDEVVELVEGGVALVAELEDGDDDVGGAVEDAILLATEVLALVEALGQNPPSAASLPATLRDPAFWTELALDLPEYLLLRWLANYKPILYGLLVLLEVVEEENVAAGGGRAAFVRRSLVWRKLTDFINDPPGYLKDLYGWGSPGGLRHQKLLDNLAALLRGMGFRPRRRRLSRQFVGADGPQSHGIVHQGNPAAEVDQLDLTLISGRLAGSFVEAGVTVLPAPQTPSETLVSGLVLANLTAGDTTLPLTLTEEWTLTVTGGLERSAALGVMLQPDQDAAFTTVAPAEEAGIWLRGEPDEPWVLLGTAGGLRLELRGLEAGLILSGAAPDPEVVFQVGGLGGEAALAVVVQAGEGDAFLQSLLGSVNLDVRINPTLRWSSRNGFSFAGEAGFEVTLPLAKVLGPVELFSLTLAAKGTVQGRYASLALEAGITASAELGPFVCSVDNLGITADLSDDPDGLQIARFGDLGLDIGFRPPDGLGLALDAGVVTGGGYLYLDRESGEYGGVVDVEVLGVGLTAIGLIATELPGPGDGWSMFLSLSVALTGVQLGFGFTLNGVGGLIGVNRGLDDDALSDGIRTGALDSILFPDDPVADAPKILSDLDAIFPPAAGQYVFAPVAKIGWGIPTLVDLDVGVAFQLPEPLTVSVLGSMEALLPFTELLILELRVDVVGTVNVTEGSLKIDAALRDSKVAGLELTGDLSVRTSFLDNPTFLAAFGGFHPDFLAPADFPTMSRLGVAFDTGDNLRIQLGGYFALTSNTVQFGAELEIWASALGFTAAGGTSFDALIQFNPFFFLIDLGVWVTIQAGSLDLLGVELRGRLSGPNPWHIAAEAKFKVLLVAKTLPVEATFGAAENETPPERAAVEELLREELALESAWQALPPLGDGDGVLLSDTTEGAQEVHPAGRIDVVQRLVPLGIRIDRYGNAELRGGDTFELESPRLGTLAVDEDDREDVTDWFAASQYFDLGEDEKLEAPSFERMTAGVRLGGHAPLGGGDVELVYDHEVVYRDPNARAAQREHTGTLYESSALALERSLAASPALAARRTSRLPRSGAQSGEFAVKEPAFVTVDAKSGERLASDSGSYYATRQTLRKTHDTQATTGPATEELILPEYEMELLA